MIKNIKIKDYTYDLPDHKIPKYPLEKRDESKLLIYKDSNISQAKFKNISDYIPSDYRLVRNNTKVIYARLLFKKETGASIEIFCLNPYKPAEYNLSFDSKNKNQWLCIVGNLKKWKTGKLEMSFGDKSQYKFFAEKIKTVGDSQLIEFTWTGDLSFAEVLDKVGKIPIPPYLKRDSEEKDKKTYQTVYSKIKGSVAAPTAGLHFTNEVMENLKAKNIFVSEITLHVGAGTFKPVKSETIAGHQMHTEHFFVQKKQIQNIYNSIGKILAVGTTTLRTLESLYWIGVNILHNKDNFNFVEQWQPYNNSADISTKKSLEAILNYMENSKFDYLQASTQIIIVPGYEFKIVDILITNFHQAQSTLLLLVGAFIGEDWRKVYEYALKSDFRFLSYGDSSLLFRKK